MPGTRRGARPDASKQAAQIGARRPMRSQVSSGWTRTVAIGSEWPLGSPAKPKPVLNAQSKEHESLPSGFLTEESKSGPNYRRHRP